MSLTVLSVAYPFAPVGPDAVGGAEQILSHLDRGLVRLGHRSIVVACEGSTTAGDLVATKVPGELLTEEVRRYVRAEHQRSIERILRRHKVDLIHMHGIDFADYLPPAGWPVLVTLHLPPGWYSGAAFGLLRPDTYLVCVSESQWRSCPASPNLLGVIQNGVPEELLEITRKKRNFAVALGRICPEKNFHVAMDAARQAGIGLILGGKVFPYEEHQRYFEREIAPRLDRQIRFAGEIGFERKKKLLAAAKCLLMPSLAPETSSLVAMEAMACGTPVIAFPSGALPEMIENGVTGFLVKDVAEMAAAIERAGDIDPDACRQRVRKRFTASRMVREYLELYERVGRLKVEHRTSNIQPRTEEITTLAGLEGLAAEWARMAECDERATIFQRPEWLIPWWKWVGEGELWTIAVRKQGRLIGLAPMYIYRGNGMREVFFLGMGTSDYLGGVFAPGFEEEATAVIIEELNARQSRWDICEFTQLREGSALLRAGDFEEELGEGEVCPAIRPPRVPTPMADKLRYYHRRAERLGAVRFERAEGDSAIRIFEELLRLQAKRWATNSVLNDERVQSWHREMLPRLSAAGVLRMWSMRMGDRVAAVHYGLADKRAWYYYLGGFDPEFEAISPGTLMIGHAVEEAAREGLGEFDFLRGSESYKYLWGAVDQKTYRLHMIATGQNAPVLARGGMQ